MRTALSGQSIWGMMYRKQKSAMPIERHPIHTHHRRMSVIGGQSRTNLVVGHDWQIDQEAENSGAKEVPETPQRPWLVPEGYTYSRSALELSTRRVQTASQEGGASMVRPLAALVLRRLLALLLW